MIVQTCTYIDFNVKHMFFYHRSIFIHKTLYRFATKNESSLSSKFDIYRYIISLFFLHKMSFSNFVKLWSSSHFDQWNLRLFMYIWYIFFFTIWLLTFYLWSFDFHLFYWDIEKIFRIIQWQTSYDGCLNRKKVWVHIMQFMSFV
jgi:hypothetical protein